MGMGRGHGLGRIATVDKVAGDEFESLVEEDDWYGDLYHSPPFKHLFKGDDSIR